MNFVELDIENFLTFKKASISLVNKGLVLVRGENKDSPKATSNGAGKSAILDAICWCLWGKTTRDISHDEVINRFVKKNCRVALTIELDNGQLLKVVRTRASTEGKPNDVVLYIDNNIQQASTADIQSKIDTLIGLSFTTFRCMMIGAGISIATLTDSEIKALIESILDTHVLATAKEVAKEKHNKVKIAIADLQAKKTYAVSRLSELQARYSKTQEESIIFEKSRETALVDLEVDYKTRIAEERQSLEAAQRSLAAVISNLDSRSKDAEKVADDVSVAQGRLEYLSELLSDAQTELQNLKFSVNAKEAQLRKTSSIGAVCSWCDQTVDEAHIKSCTEQFQEELDVLTDQLNALKLEVAEHAKQRDIAYKNLITLQSALSNHSINIALLKTDRTRLTALIDKHTENAQRLEKELADKIEYTNVVTVNPFAKLLESLESDIKDLQESISDVNEELAALLVDEEKLAYWVTGFSTTGIRNHMLEAVIPLLNSTVKTYCDILTDGDLSIEFHTHKTLKNGTKKEMFYIDVTYKNGGESYRASSKGEKARVDLAIACAIGDLAQCRVRQVLNFRFFDEPFESVDEAGQEAILALLKDQEQKYGTVMCVTHKPSFQEMFTKTMTVVKTKNVSTIKESA